MSVKSVDVRRPRCAQAGAIPRRIVLPAAAFAAIALASLAGILPARAQTSIKVEVAATRHIYVTQYKSVTVRFGKAFASTVIGAPDIADVLPMSDRVIYIQGKKLGTTNVSVFGKDKHLLAILDVTVSIDAASIARQIRSSTGSRGIRVSSSNGQVVLSGVARDATVANRAVTIAKAATPKLPVINAMSVASAQQVMLKVRFLEVTREAGRDLGVNWYLAKSGRGFNTGLGAPTQVGQSPTATPGGIPLFQTLSTFAGSTTGSPFGVAIANLINNNNTSVDVMVSALESKGLVRSLAEPDLVALSGDTASFLAGGEIPVPVVQSSTGSVPVINVEYKPFGVQLTFSPTVLKDSIINLRLAPSVSELDYTNAVTISGFQIPALTKREARTTIELRDGQSFAIAGLLQSRGTRNAAQIPWIGSLPVLGTLFRSTAF
ncbi:MAG: type II and III secretion system protein family protein, partial [Pseudolabrys sp.]